MRLKSSWLLLGIKEGGKERENERGETEEIKTILETPTNKMSMTKIRNTVDRQLEKMIQHYTEKKNFLWSTIRMIRGMKDKDYPTNQPCMRQMV